MLVLRKVYSWYDERRVPIAVAACVAMPVVVFGAARLTIG